MNERILIRPYVPGDVDATIEIFLRSIREVSSKDYSAAEIEAWAKVEDRALWAERRMSRPAWMAEIAGNPVGFSDLASDGCLDMMFVHPGYQGVGVATCLLGRVEEEALKLGFRRISTEASRTARPFFERKGFRVITRQTVEKRGQGLENFLMENFYA
ncbi:MULTISPECIES: GNAT family N-acetyltransferase [Rhizobium]|uniref:GNAT family N-acetyltransferase n=1 Tax=Rhizobium TaxID=379 RepID=UPI0007EB9900|nr:MULTISPECIES: GNAT family N-acetyltransferase [Rhizobium]ANK91865.1 GCN5-related N-acetyltransferase protein [Rhizobium sp. N6212]ANK97899.1 GCN5-related N-acetyltransferase protein [Rhizobium sp. N621]ANL03978.1 GCN5-related N-acetyltransferase protein [Rhizobium esperanzae]ANL10024.1 GCN5-related N-acetyltransferase protein [Rhizobium sp. N1341]ANL22076.1 GCN5-related N-acetyltransferase protein [Rhizobium sp. N113]